MERRNVMKVAGLAIGGAALTAAGSAAAAPGAKAPGAILGKAAGAAGGRRPELVALAEETDACIRACEVCIRHCQEQLAGGDTLLGECLRKCLDVVPLCESTGTLANYDSALVGKIAKVCLEACEACAESCKPHVGHHAVCKACHDACLACAKACKAA